MARVPGLSRRGNVWQFRVRVPDKLRKTIGKGEIVKSLGTVSHAEAARLARIERLEADRRFDEAEAFLRTAPVEELSESELYHLARAFFFRLEKQASQVSFDPHERAELAAITASDLAAIGDWDDQQAVQQVATEFAEWAKVRVKKGSKAFVDLCGAVQAAHVEHYGREYDRLVGRPERRNEERFRDIDKHHPPKSRLTLAEAVKRYVDEPSKSDVAKKTRAAWGFRLGAWVDLLGSDKQVANITRDDVRDGLAVLMRVPSNAAKLYPGVPLRKVVEATAKDDVKLLSPKSVQLYIDALSSLFRYLNDEQVLTTNPAQRLKGPPIPKEKPRRPWSPEELNRFFSREPFDRPWNGARERSWLYWMPLLALFSGSREGELAGLEKSDVFEVDGMWFVRILENETRGVKTEHSNRAFPVHRTLVDLGFADFVRSVPDGGPLFVDIRPSELGPVHWCQKMIGRHVRKVFSDPKVVFHSLRHNFRDAAREANLPQEVVGAIGGWKEGTHSAMAGYGAGPSYKNLSEWMAKIEYPGLKLEHLVPTEPTIPPVRYRQRPRRS